MLCIEKGAAQRVAEILRDPQKESTVNCVILIMMALWFATMALWFAAEGNLLVHHTMMTLSCTTEDSVVHHIMMTPRFTTEGPAELHHIWYSIMHTNTRIPMHGYPCMDIHV